MQPKPLPIIEAVTFAVKTFFTDTRLFVITGILTGFFYFGFFALYRELSKYDFFDIVRPIINEHLVFLSLVAVLFYSIGAGFFGGLVAVGLEFYSTGSSSFSRFFSSFYKFPQMSIGLAVLLLIFGVGIVLGIIPGFYFGSRFCLFPYFIIDQNMGLLSAFKQSWRVTRNYVWSIAMYILGLIIAYDVIGMWQLLDFWVAFAILTEVYLYKFLTSQPQQQNY